MRIPRREQAGKILAGLAARRIDERIPAAETGKILTALIAHRVNERISDRVSR
nr:hypothetical protein [Shuttleworthia satelles]